MAKQQKTSEEWAALQTQWAEDLAERIHRILTLGLGRAA